MSIRLAQKKCYRPEPHLLSWRRPTAPALRHRRAPAAAIQTPASPQPSLKGGHNRDAHCRFPKRPRGRRTTELPQSASTPLSLPATLALINPFTSMFKGPSTPSYTQIAWFGDPGHLSVKRQKTRPARCHSHLVHVFSIGL